MVYSSRQQLIESYLECLVFSVACARDVFVYCVFFFFHEIRTVSSGTDGSLFYFGQVPGVGALSRSFGGAKQTLLAPL